MRLQSMTFRCVALLLVGSCLAAPVLAQTAWVVRRLPVDYEVTATHGLGGTAMFTPSGELVVGFGWTDSSAGASGPTLLHRLDGQYFDTFLFDEQGRGIRSFAIDDFGTISYAGVNVIPSQFLFGQDAGMWGGVNEAAFDTGLPTALNPVLALNSRGVPAALGGTGGGPIYLEFDVPAGAWNAEQLSPVRTAPPPQYHTLCFDAADEPLLAVIDSAGYTLKIGRRVNGEWTFHTVGTTTPTSGVSIARSPGGTVAFTYLDTAGNLRYALLGSEEQPAVVANVGPATLNVQALAFNPDGLAGIVVKGMLYRQTAGGSWTAEALPGKINPACNLTFDALGNPYIVASGAGAPQVMSPALPLPIPGDANDDGTVDTQDFTILKTHFGLEGAGWSQGDFNGDGLVDIQDFTILKTYFGSSGSQTTIPEPATLLLLSPFAALVLRKRRASPA